MKKVIINGPAYVFITRKCNFFTYLFTDDFYLIIKLTDCGISYKNAVVNNRTVFVTANIQLKPEI
jgi:hypothetical protein